MGSVVRTPGINFTKRFLLRTMDIGDKEKQLVDVLSSGIETPTTSTI